MKRKNALSLLLPCLIAGNMYANEPTSSISFTTPSKEITAFRNLGVGVTAGTTGLGIEFSTPINSYLQVRGGFSMMPKFTLSMDFDLNTANPGNTAEEGSQFNGIINTLEEMTGTKVNDKVSMLCEPTIYNFKALVDIFPFENKKWHFSAGIYAGSSSIGRAYNATEAMPALFAANTFNTIYEKAANYDPIVEIGDFCLYLDDELTEKILSYGRMGVELGERVSDGTIYKMEPNEYSMVTAEIKTNSVKPYLGFGYGSNTFNSNSIYNISFDCGVLFWGGAPNIILHDGTNLTTDVTNINGKMGDYVNLAKRFKAFPVISISISRRLF